MAANDHSRAAQYVRVSTERQDYSLDFQIATNAAYALERGITVVRTYTDAGISGLAIHNRAGLRSLLADVVQGGADFSTILVYDVSRWGRFQNPDQAAHYEFICAEAGVKIAYCAEPFENDGSPTSTLLKHLKRAMAAEYSRDLSQKVSRAQRGLLAEGFWIGGRVPFGFRRAFTRRDGKLIPSSDSDYLRKQQGVRTKLVLGPDSEVEMVRRVFAMYLRSTASFATVSRKLAGDADLVAAFGVWSPKRVKDTLRNEIYVGRLIGGRRIKAVGESWGRPAPQEQWIIAENAAPAIVSDAIFAAVRRKRLRRAGPVAKEMALADLHQLLGDYGDVSQRILRLHGRWSAGVYARIFGSVANIRELMDKPVPDRYAHLSNQLNVSNKRRQEFGQTYTDKQLRMSLQAALARHGRLSEQILNASGNPNASTFRRRFGGMMEVYRQVGYEPSERQQQAIASAQKRNAMKFR